MAEPWPTDIRLKRDRRTLEVEFDTSESFDLPAEFLRVLSPSAEVQGHSEAERRTIGGKRDVEILKVEPIGNYAVRLTFDDTHSTGLYSWGYLYRLGRDREALWAAYLAELEEKGLRRER